MACESLFVALFAIAYYARSLMLVLMLMSMLMSHASVDSLVNYSFVLPSAYAYVANENQALEDRRTADAISVTSHNHSHFRTINNQWRVLFCIDRDHVK